MLALLAVLALADVGVLRAAESAADIYASLAKSTVVIYPDAHRHGHLGSGFVVRPGIIATNAHVLAELSSGVVRLIGGERTFAIQRVLVLDAKHDLALVAVAGLEAPPLPLATVFELKVGQRVYAFGNPGYKGDVYEGTFCDGQVTALRGADSIKAAVDILHADVVQVNVAITHGNSGGPLVDSDGEVVGLTSSVVEAQPGVTVAGLAFAVPVKFLLDLMPDLKAAHYRFYARMRMAQARREGGLTPVAAETELLRMSAREVFREPYLLRMLDAPLSDPSRNRSGTVDRAALATLVDQAIERYIHEDYLGGGRYDAALAYLDGIAPMAALTSHAGTVQALREQALRRIAKPAATLATEIPRISP